MCGLATFPDPMGMTVARPSRRGLLVPAAAVCLAVLAPFALASLVLFLLGWHLQPILSASMRPSYPSGALVAVEPIDASQVRPGMVIVFVDPRQPGRLVAHRVVEQVSGDRLAFRTRGDANVVDDPFPVSAESVQGRVRWGIPGLGSVVSALSGGWGAALLIGAPAGTLVGTEGYDRWRRRRHQPRDPDAPAGQ